MNWGTDYDILRSTPILAWGILGHIEVLSIHLLKYYMLKLFYILINNVYMVQVPIYKFLKKSWGLICFDSQLSCNFLSKRYDIGHIKVPPQHFGTLKIYYFHEIITAHTHCNIWKSFKWLWSVLPELLPLLYYYQILDKTREFLPPPPSFTQAFLRKNAS